MMYTAGNGKNATKSHSNKAELQATESKSLQGTETLSSLIYFFVSSGGGTHMPMCLQVYACGDQGVMSGVFYDSPHPSFGDKVCH